MKSIFLLALVLLLSPLAAQTTSGDNSPAIIAKNFSAVYGVRADAVEAILKIYEKDGLDPAKRKSSTESLLKKYQQAPEKKSRAPLLSDASKKDLGLSPALANALDWDLYAGSKYLTTTGINSPAVVAEGDVNIWYGIPPKALRALATKLEEDKITFEDFQKKLDAQVERFKELEKSLVSREDEMAKEAKILLDDGKIDEAVKVLQDRRYAFKKQRERLDKREAESAFDLGNAFSIQLKYKEATQQFQDAVALDPNNSAYLLALGNIENTNAHYDLAIEYYQKALAIDTIGIIDQPEKAALLYNNLGVVWDSKGEYDRAIASYEKALAIHSVTSGNEHPDVATQYNNLGTSWHAKGEYDRSIALFEKALSIFVQAFGEKHPDVAVQYSNLGSAWEAKGEYDRAIAFYEKALPIFVQAFGEKHPNVAVQYKNFGSVWQAKGEYDRAIAFHEKALAIDSVAFGNKHPDVARDYNNLGSVWHAKGEYDHAIALFEKALPIFVQTFGEKHPNIAALINNLGGAWEAKGEYDRAIVLYEKALAIDSVAFGNKHIEVAREYNNLGSSWYRKGEYDRAIAFFEKALPIFVQTFGEKHPNLAVVFTNLGGAWHAKGEYDRAIALYEKALAIDTVAFGSNHPDVASLYLRLGSAWQFKGEYDRAIEMYEKAKTIFLLFYPSNHPNLQMAAQSLARAANERGMEFFREKKYNEALPYSQKALENAEAGQDIVYSITCLNNIGAAQKRLGHYAEGLAALKEGIKRAEEFNQGIDKEIETLPIETRQKPEVEAKIAELKNLPLIRRMQYHSAGCLAGLGRKEEANKRYQQLLKEARETNDTRLLEDLKNDGVKD